MDVTARKQKVVYNNSDWEIIVLVGYQNELSVGRDANDANRRQLSKMIGRDVWATGYVLIAVAMIQGRKWPQFQDCHGDRASLPVSHGPNIAHGNAGRLPKITKNLPILTTTDSA